MVILGRESEPARNDAASAPAVIFKCGSGSSHFKEEKRFGRHFHKKCQESSFLQKHIRLL